MALNISNQLLSESSLLQRAEFQHLHVMDVLPLNHQQTSASALWLSHPSNSVMFRTGQGAAEAQTGSNMGFEHHVASSTEEASSSSLSGLYCNKDCCKCEILQCSQMMTAFPVD